MLCYTQLLPVVVRQCLKEYTRCKCSCIHPSLYFSLSLSVSLSVSLSLCLCLSLCLSLSLSLAPSLSLSFSLFHFLFHRIVSCNGTGGNGAGGNRANGDRAGGNGAVGDGRAARISPRDVWISPHRLPMVNHLRAVGVVSSRCWKLRWSQEFTASASDWILDLAPTDESLEDQTWKHQIILQSTNHIHGPARLSRAEHGHKRQSRASTNVKRGWGKHHAEPVRTITKKQKPDRSGP